MYNYILPLELPSLSWYTSIWINGDETELLVQVEQIDWLYNVPCFILKSVSEPHLARLPTHLGCSKEKYKIIKTAINNGSFAVFWRSKRGNIHYVSGGIGNNIFGGIFALGLFFIMQKHEDYDQVKCRFTLHPEVMMVLRSKGF